MTKLVTSVAFAVLLAGVSTIAAQGSFVPTHAKHVPTPPGVKCTGVKINTKGPMAVGTAVVNCANGIAYTYKRPAPVVPLPLFAGATSETAHDIDKAGDVVGTILIPPSVVLPAEWPAVGAPFILPHPNQAAALGMNLGGGAIVGDANTGPVVQCFELKPAPGFIPPSGPPSELTDVNKGGLAVGQFNSGAATAGLPAGPCKNVPAIISAAPVSIAWAINDANKMVGFLDFAPGCGGLDKGMGYFFPFPGGPLGTIGVLGSDCTSSAEDNNNVGDTVGFSASAVRQQAVLFNGPLVNLNTVAIVGGRPWSKLMDASGVDDNEEIVATGLDHTGLMQAFVLF